jgi:uncharacterized protein YjbI with pentapeptide repeats
MAERRRFTHSAEEEKEARKRTWQRGALKRTLRTKIWDLTGLRGKTAWDWLQLLIVPLVLAVIGFTLTSAQQSAQQLRIEQQRAQEAALQGYLDTMKELLLDENLRSAGPDSSVRALANAQTSVTLERVDPSRKEVILRLLNDAHLIDANASLINLDGADLSYVHLDHMDFSDTDLSGADLSGAHLTGADLTNADLTNADLTSAEGITKEKLERQAKSLEGAIMPDGTKHP